MVAREGGEEGDHKVVEDTDEDRVVVDGTTNMLPQI